jgi:hypothetical protein
MIVGFLAQKVYFIAGSVEGAIRQDKQKKDFFESFFW